MTGVIGHTSLNTSFELNLIFYLGDLTVQLIVSFCAPTIWTHWIKVNPTIQNKTMFRPFTRSLDCVISFTKDYVSLQNRSSRWMIGTGCESHGLYQLQISHMLARLWILHLSFMLGWVIIVLPRCNNLFQVCLMCLVYHVSRVSYGNTFIVLFIIVSHNVLHLILP